MINSELQLICEWIFLSKHLDVIFMLLRVGITLGFMSTRGLKYEDSYNWALWSSRFKITREFTG